MDIMLASIIAVISGKALVQVLLWVIAIGVVFGLLWWLLDYCKIPEPFNRVARVILAVAAVIFLINLIMGLVGEPFIKW